MMNYVIGLVGPKFSPAVSKELMMKYLTADEITDESS